MNYFPGNETPLMRWAGKIGTFFGLSILWILCCIPLLTIMPASIALYDSVVACVHGDEPSPFRHFFALLKENFFSSVLLSLLWIVLVVVFVLSFGVLNTLSAENPIFSVYSVIYAGSMLIPLTMLTWIVPLQNRFHYSFFELHRTAMRFVIQHLPTTVALVGIMALGTALVFAAPPMLLLIPAIVTTLQSALTEKVLTRYEKDEFS